MPEQGSMIERLRAQREEAMKRDKSLTLEVPGWSGLLHVRYKPVEWERLHRLLLTADATDAKAALAQNLDALGSACDAILVREDGSPELRSLADTLREQGEQVHGEVRFDSTLADVLGLEVEGELGLRPPKSVAETVLAAFSGAVSPELAVGDHAGRLASWMRGVSLEVDEDLLGG